MESRAHALMAGLFVLVFSLSAALAIWWFSGNREITRDLLLVTQRNVTGLNPQATVRYRGINAGRVQAIVLDPADPRSILVRVSVGADLPLTKATTAQLNYQGVTGLAYILLEDNGSTREPLVAAEGQLPRIAIKPTLFDSLGERAADIIGQVGELTTRLNRVLDEKNSRNLGQTLENLAVASDGLRQMPEVMASVREALSAANLKRLGAILAHLEVTAGQAAPLTVEMRGLVASMQDLSKRLGESGGAVGDELTGRTLPGINAVVQELQHNSRQLTRILGNLEDAPQSLIFGHPAVPPGPGEPGFVIPAKQ
ncbi:MAG: MlaD family protein [Proteobacteria bacterium]|nr:MlaD family protein [Pseudomonadota bacterium]